MKTLGPLLAISPVWRGNIGKPEVAMLDGSDPTSDRDGDGRFTCWHPHVCDEDIYRDEFLTAVRRAKLSIK